MKKIMMTDITLRTCAANGTLTSFKDKVAVARNIGKLNASVIELPAVINSKENEMLVTTVSAFVNNAVISVPAGYTEESVEVTAKALSNLKAARICISVPVSTVQMEYICKKKPKAVLEMIPALVKKAKEYINDVEFCAVDATRAEAQFLKSAITAAQSAGATTVSVCDNAGTMLPQEFGDFIASVVEYTSVPVCVQCSDELHLSTACCVAAINAGATAVKVALAGNQAADLKEIAQIIRVKGDAIGIASDLKITELDSCVVCVNNVIGQKTENEIVISDDAEDDTVIKSGIDNKKIAEIVKARGYELSAEDNMKVFEAVNAVAQKKVITAKELDAIVAVNAMQVPAAYKLKSFVINSGNIIAATANIVMEKEGKTIAGICASDGPIDAAFLAIEQIIGHHYELDDFQIHSITEGRQAMGSAVVRLRSDGVVYSGRGLSTDIIEASIKAYLNAVNKIVYEENV
ncbi:MAG: hypothetical protein J6I80_00765 [Clostridia bacterium]|nr:hypothetical protein [Clostridia bacterium]